MKLLIPTLSLSIFILSAPANAEHLPWGNGADEPYCREYTSTVRVAGKPQQAHGVACMEPDGTWKIQPQEEEQAEIVPPPPPPPPTVEYVPVPVPYYAGYHRWPHRHWRHRHYHHGTYVGFGYGPHF